MFNQNNQDGFEAIKKIRETLITVPNEFVLVDEGGNPTDETVAGLITCLPEQGDIYLTFNDSEANGNNSGETTIRSKPASGVGLEIEQRISNKTEFRESDKNYLCTVRTTVFPSVRSSARRMQANFSYRACDEFDSIEQDVFTSPGTIETSFPVLLTAPNKSVSGSSLISQFNFADLGTLVSGNMRTALENQTEVIERFKLANNQNAFFPGLGVLANLAMTALPTVIGVGAKLVGEFINR